MKLNPVGHCSSGSRKPTIRKQTTTVFHWTTTTRKMTMNSLVLIFSLIFFQGRFLSVCVKLFSHCVHVGHCTFRAPTYVALFAQFLCTILIFRDSGLYLPRPSNPTPRKAAPSIISFPTKRMKCLTDCSATLGRLTDERVSLEQSCVSVLGNTH